MQVVVGAVGVDFKFQMPVQNFTNLLFCSALNAEKKKVDSDTCLLICIEKDTKRI